MNNITVLADFTTASKSAVRVAAELARDLKCNLNFVHYCNIPSYTGTLGIAYNEKEIIGELLDKLKHEYLPVLKKNGFNESKAQFIISMGISFVDSVTKEVKKLKTDLIVMGKSHTSYIERFLFGNHLSHLYDKVNVPLLAIPEKFPLKSIKSIGICSDLKSIKKGNGTDVLAGLTNTYKSSITILNVAPYVKKNEDKVIKAHLARIDKLFPNVKLKFDVIEDLDFVDGLNHYCEKNKLSLVAVFPHSHNILEKIFAPNNSKNVALEFDRPTLFIRDK